jgi:hypothetical protein
MYNWLGHVAVALLGLHTSHTSEGSVSSLFARLAYLQIVLRKHFYQRVDVVGEGWTGKSSGIAIGAYESTAWKIQVILKEITVLSL